MTFPGLTYTLTLIRIINPDAGSNNKMFTNKKETGALDRPLTIGTRVNAAEQARVDAAVRLRAITRSEYIRAAVLQQATRDLRAAAESHEDTGQ